MTCIQIENDTSTAIHTCPIHGVAIHRNMNGTFSASLFGTRLCEVRELEYLRIRNILSKDQGNEA